ncbi:LuxR C-terminal-related transcriptional regulator [Microbacterium testaceum]|uniref:helix-turn-helix transcriptional regulator n=1 Tax=Microbacterium testaceum TaxID=2033 RepID=UPI003830DA0D
MVRGLLPNERPPSVLDMEALLSVETGPTPRAWIDASARTLEALLVARCHLDDISGAVALIDTHFANGRLRVPGTLHPATRSTLLSAVSEVYSAAGSPRRAGLYAASAVSHAPDAVSSYRAHAVRALAYALNGEVDSAGQSIESCRMLERESGWDPIFRDYSLLLAEILVSSAALNAPALERLAEEMRTTAPVNMFWQYTARTAEAMAALISSDYGKGLALLTTLVGGADALNSHAMVRGFALGVYADTLLARGEVRRALALLQDVPSPSEHALCYGMQRAAAYLALGRDRSVLEATDACIAMGSEHCVRTLAPVLVRRAIASLRLGNNAAALTSFEEAFALCESLGESFTPFIALPTDALHDLLTMLTDQHPSTMSAVARLREGLASVPTREVVESLPSLSPREERLALLLRGALSLPQLAEELNVSVNTVKSQLRSIYTKLDVSGREAAVAVLESQGFFV